MAQGHFQRLTQAQKQILAPILQQNVQLLVLNTMDLMQEINKKLDDNPFLDVEPGSEKSTEIDSIIEKALTNKELSKQKDDEFEDLEKNIYEDSSRFQFDKKASSRSDENTKQNFLENTITSKEPLYQDLKAQIMLLDLSPHEMKIADMILSCLNEQGVLKASTLEIANYLKVPQEDIDKILEKIQKLDPPGVGARDTKEFILLQVEYNFGRNSDAYDVAKVYFEAFEELENETPTQSEKKAEKEIKQIHYNAQKIRKKVTSLVCERLSLKASEVEEILKEIEENITPTPSEDNSEEQSSYIIPDIVVSVDPESFAIEIKVFDDYLPKLKLNKEYKKYLRKERGVEQSQDLKELKNKYEEAKSFVNLIKRRSSTLYNLSMHLVEIQREFFLKGAEFIKPLTIKEMAEILDVHESTVSRIVNNKYISTPYGVYPLKFLFSHRVGDNKSDVSAKKINEMIKKIIESEGGNKKLSDSKIEQILKNMGIKISRRTVAKYRKKLNIRSSFER